MKSRNYKSQSSTARVVIFLRATKMRFPLNITTLARISGATPCPRSQFTYMLNLIMMLFNGTELWIFIVNIIQYILTGRKPYHADPWLSCTMFYFCFDPRNNILQFATWVKKNCKIDYKDRTVWKQSKILKLEYAIRLRFILICWPFLWKNQSYQFTQVNKR